MDGVCDGQVMLVVMMTILQGVYSRPDGYITSLDPICRTGKFNNKLKFVEWDCTGFVQCNSNMAIWVNCPRDLIFNEAEQGCRDPPYYDGPCTNPRIRADMYCPERPDLKFPHPESCSKYYDCKQDAPQMGLAKYENECVFPMLFDSYYMKCNKPEEVDCGSIWRPQDKCDYLLECIDKSCKGRKDGYNHKLFKSFQPEYMLCESQLVVENLVCPEGEVFDPIQHKCSADVTESLKQRCTDIPTLKFASHLSCSQYYDCRKIEWHAGWAPYLTECPYFQLFDPIGRKCATYSSVTCDNRPEPKAPCEYKVGHCSTGTCIPCEASCLNHTDGNVAYPGDPSRYMQCQSERTIRIENCIGARLFWKGQCRRTRDIPPDAFLTTPVPTIPTTPIPTEPPTQPPTQPSTQPPTEPPTQPPTQPPTEPPTEPPTQPPTQPPTEPPTPPPTEPPTPPPTDAPTTTVPPVELRTRLSSLEEEISLLRAALRAGSCATPPALNTLEGVVVSIVFRDNQTQASYSCSSGYAMCGSRSSISCIEGVWEKPTIECVQSKWGPPTVPASIPVTCPFSPWFSIHAEAIIIEKAGGSLLLLSQDNTAHVSVIFKPAGDSFNVEVSGGPTSVSTILPAAYRVGDPIELDIAVGMDGYTVSLNGQEDVLHGYEDALHTVGSVQVIGSLTVNSLHILPASVTHLITNPGFEDSAVLSDDNFLTFSVHACQDVIVYISPSETLDRPNSIQLDLGSGDNSEITVKMCSTCPEESVSYVMLDCHKLRPFWLRLRQSLEGSLVDIGTGFGMSEDSLLFSSLPFSGNQVRAVFVTSPTGGASIILSHPVVEKCGVPPPLERGYPLVRTTGDVLDYRCETGHAFCGQSSQMTCGQDGQYSGLWGACFKSVHTQINAIFHNQFLGCPFQETSAISLHIHKFGDVTIKLMEAAVLNFQIVVTNNMLKLKHPSTSETASSITPLQEETTHHVVIYNTGQQYEIVINGNAEASLAYTGSYADISHVDISSSANQVQIFRLEYIPEVISRTCELLPEDPSMVGWVKAESDISLGSQLEIECTAGYMWCGNLPKVTCNRFGEWSKSQGRCVQNEWVLSAALSEDLKFSIPKCLAEYGPVDIKVYFDIAQTGEKLELHHNEKGVGPHKVEVDMGQNQLTIHPGATTVPVSPSSKSWHLTAVIFDAKVEFYFSSTKIGTNVISFPKSSFHTLLVSKGGATLTQVSMKTLMAQS